MTEIFKNFQERDTNYRNIVLSRCRAGLEMSHNNVDIYKGIEYLSNPHYQLLEYMFVLCINKQNNAVKSLFR